LYFYYCIIKLKIILKDKIIKLDRVHDLSCGFDGLTKDY